MLKPEDRRDLLERLLEIYSGEIEKLAKDLGVSEYLVRSWLSRSYPGDEHTKRILDLYSSFDPIGARRFLQERSKIRSRERRAKILIGASLTLLFLAISYFFITYSLAAFIWYNPENAYAEEYSSLRLNATEMNLLKNYLKENNPEDLIRIIENPEFYLNESAYRALERILEEKRRELEEESSLAYRGAMLGFLRALSESEELDNRTITSLVLTGASNLRTLAEIARRQAEFCRASAEAYERLSERAWARALGLDDLFRRRASESRIKMNQWLELERMCLEGERNLRSSLSLLLSATQLEEKIRELAPR